MYKESYYKKLTAGTVTCAEAIITIAKAITAIIIAFYLFAYVIYRTGELLTIIKDTDKYRYLTPLGTQAEPRIIEIKAKIDAKDVVKDINPDEKENKAPIGFS